MTPPPAYATVEEIHAHFVEQLNSALRLTGMFGGEPALRALVEHLLFVEREPEAWEELRGRWEKEGAWSSLGVTGAFRDLVPDRSYLCGSASVYAEFARRRGWLVPDRTLTSEEYAVLAGRVGQWAEEDRTWPDITAEFGAPSVLFGGSNPRYGKTLGYLCADLTQPMILFDLWNDGASADAGRDQPSLLAVRRSDEPFRQSFRFTPEGRRRRPAADVC
ncbi:hypothetical protein ACIQMP_25045 [Streptomyces sp. NPDC091385]|uniref:hypothetical protein n=1 Tax=Streptomyces sp. NPDC091385 TaxID=3365997 RepID=UPI00382635F6